MPFQTTLRNLLLLLIHQVFKAQTYQDITVKTWIADTNFKNPRNWLDSRLPCSKDRVIFPSDAKIVTFMPKSLSFAEVVLPMQGDLILQEGFELNLPDRDSYDDSCRGQDVHFVVNTDSWFESEKWNISSSQTFPSQDTAKNPAVPHAFRIPCLADRVVFPKDHTFQVHIGSAAVRVSSLEINGQNYDKSELEGMLASPIGNLLFPDSPQITITGDTCSDKSGCICGTNEPQIMSKICSHVSCPSTECSDPIKPAGHCCPLCAAYFEMEYESEFQMKELIGFQATFLMKLDFADSVKSFTSKVSVDILQTVFVDSGKVRGAASDVAALIQAKLVQDIASRNSLHLRTLKLYSSKKWNAGVPTTSYYSTYGLSSGGVVGIIFAIAALIGAVVAWYIYKRRQIPGFSFARFDFHTSKVELELGTTPHEDLDPDEAAAAAPNAFDNPVYDTVKDIVKLPKELEEVDIPDINVLGEEENSVENPMFFSFDPPQKENLP